MTRDRKLRAAKRRLLDRLRKELPDRRVIDAMERVPRESFVPESMAASTYDDVPLPIGEGQTISQPFIVAVMISELELRRTDSVLEIGTGSGYQAAVLSELAVRVTSVERIPSLAEGARARLAKLGYRNVVVHQASAQLGWPSGGPYDAIVVAAAAPRLPRELIDQLAPRGRLVVPVGSRDAQELMKVTRTGDRFSVRTMTPCRFVPLVGEGAWPEERS